MNLQELKKKSPADLILQAEKLVLQQQTRDNFVSSIICPNKYVKCPCLEIRV